MSEIVGLIHDLDMVVALRRRGYRTIHRKFKNWAEVSAFVNEIAERRDYPEGSVLTVTDWTGTDRFLLRGGGNSPARMIKLSDAVRLAVSNPSKDAPAPGSGTAAE